MTRQSIFLFFLQNLGPARAHTPTNSPKIIKKVQEHSHPANKDKIHTCEICGDAYSNSGNLLAHINSIHKGINEYQCEVCGKDFNNASRPLSLLKEHMMYVHEGVKKDKKHKCDFCDKAYIQAKDLKEHVSTIHEGKNDCVYANIHIYVVRF